MIDISIPIDTDLKEQAEALFSELGLSLTAAIDLFIRQTVQEGSLPFGIEPDFPNEQTQAAMVEAEKISKDSSVKGYEDLDELFSDLKN